MVQRRKGLQIVILNSVLGGNSSPMLIILVLNANSRGVSPHFFKHFHAMSNRPRSEGFLSFKLRFQPKITCPALNNDRRKTAALRELHHINKCLNALPPVNSRGYITSLETSFSFSSLFTSSFRTKPDPPVQYPYPQDPH